MFVSYDDEALALTLSLAIPILCRQSYVDHSFGTEPRSNLMSGQVSRLSGCLSTTLFPQNH